MCTTCDALEILNECGIDDTSASLKDTRDKAIAKGYATRQDTENLLSFVQAAMLFCSHRKCEHGEEFRIRDVKASLPEKVPCSFFSALYSDFDLLAGQARLGQ